MTTVIVTGEVASTVAVEAAKVATVYASAEVPASGHPISISLIAGVPDVAGARARRDVGDRSAQMNSKFSRLGSCCCQPKTCGHHCCTQHPIPHALHKPSVPAGLFQARPAFFRLRLVSCCLVGQAGYVWIEPQMQLKVAVGDKNKLPQLSQQTGFIAAY